MRAMFVPANALLSLDLFQVDESTFFGQLFQHHRTSSPITHGGRRSGRSPQSWRLDRQSVHNKNDPSKSGLLCFNPYILALNKLNKSNKS